MNAVSLFSGALGLDLGLEQIGIHSTCYVENDADCLRLIAARRPDRLVADDVHRVDAELEARIGQVELVAGGFPCQDLSYAGRGAGLDGDRSGLWFEMVRVIRDLQPRLVLVENVPGLLTRGIVVVLHELAKAGYVGRWFSIAAAEMGAPHRRERIFIIAVRADERRGAFLDSGHPAGLFDESGWLSPQESLFDAEPLRRLGKRGRWTLDRVYEDDGRLALDDLDDDATLLPTPNAYESTPTAAYVETMRDVGIDPEARLYLPGRKWHAQRTLSRVAPVLLPTPGANDSTGAEDETRKARQDDGRTGGPSLRDLPHLLPTPAARDGKGANPNERDGGLDLPGATKLLPTPVVTDSFGGRRSTARTADWTSNPGTSLTDALWETEGRDTDTNGKALPVRPDDGQIPLLPTPTGEDGERGRNGAGPDRLGAKTFDRPLLPTPIANEQNPGAGGELRAAIEHGPGRRNGSGVDSLGRPNLGRPSRLLPTPQGADGEGGRQEKGAMRRGGKRPSGQKATLTLGTAVELRDELGESPFADAEPEATESLLPTPTASDGDRTSEQGPRHYAGGGDNLTLLGAARRTEPARWGVYEAVTRWAHALGRDAPEPTDDRGRLSPWFVEWMLGFDHGWTEVDGISRTARLRLLGNSVQVQVGAVVGLQLLALDREAATSEA